MRGDGLRAISLFGGMADDQLAELAEGGTEVRIEPGVELFHEGEQADFWWVLIDGAIDLLRRIGPEDTMVGRMDVPGRWAGGFPRLGRAGRLPGDRPGSHRRPGAPGASGRAE